MSKTQCMILRLHASLAKAQDTIALFAPRAERHLRILQASSRTYFNQYIAMQEKNKPRNYPQIFTSKADLAKLGDKERADTLLGSSSILRPQQ